MKATEWNEMSNEEKANELLKYGFSLENIKRKLNGERLISDQVGCWLLERQFLKGVRRNNKNIYTDYFEFDRYCVGTDWEDKVILDYVFKYNSSLILKCDSSKEDVVWYILYEENRVKLFNKVLTRSCVSGIVPIFLWWNIDVFYQLFIRSLAPFSASIEDGTFFSKKEEEAVEQEVSISLVKDYFDEIDETGRLGQEFLELLNSDKMILWNRNDEEQRRLILDKYSFLEEYLEEGSCCFWWEDTCWVLVQLNGTLSDSVAMVHEFFHWYSMYHSKDSYSEFVSIFREFPSMFFERHFLVWLGERGYDGEKLMASYHFRDVDCWTTFSNKLDFFHCLKKFSKNEVITLDDFIVDYTDMIEKYRNANQDGRFDEALAYYEDQMKRKEEMAKERCDQIWMDLIMKRSDYSKGVYYLIGRVLVDYLIQDPKKFVPFMLNFSQNLACLEIDPVDIMNVLLPAHIAILFQPIYKEHGIKRIPILKKVKQEERRI